MIRYILYKVLNFLISRRYARDTSDPLLRVLGSPDLRAKHMYLDLSDPSTHLGDRLFFLPFVATALDSGYKVRLSEKDIWTNDLLKTIFGRGPLPTGNADSSELVVFPQPSLLNFHTRYRNALLVDFTDRRTKQKITQQIRTSFGSLCQLKLLNSKAVAPIIDAPFRLPFMLNSERYYLFSNYINSGSFRKLIKDEKILLDKCKQLKQDGYKIVHVGSSADKIGDSKVYPFVDVDLRGCISVIDLVNLVRVDTVIGAVTYDNFLMHLIGLYRKRAYVLFRGRFFEANVRHHMSHVNNTFFSDESLLEYL